ncbi:MAG: HEAT repeat domain-containing protein [Verrucomicrobiia bacterium]
MRISIIYLILVAGLLIGSQTFAQNPSQIADQIEKLLNESVNYRYGENRQKLLEVENLLHMTQDLTTRREIEKIFSQMLLKPETTLEFKEFLCRQLWYLGTAQSVSALSALSTNENTVLWACYALVRNPSKEAETALVEALKIAPKDIKSRLAIIAALGQRRAESAVDSLSQLCNNIEPQISKAALKALGEIGNEKAANVLLKLYENDNPNTHQELASALIECACWLSKEDKKSVAFKIYEKLYNSTNEKAVKQAALRGIVEDSENQGVDYIIKILKSENEDLHIAAIGSINLLKNPGSFKKLVKSINDFLPSIQPFVINLLAEKREQTLLPIAQKLAFSPDQQTRIASIKALGMIGDESTVQTLVKIVSQNRQPEKNIAIASLKSLSKKSCDKEILSFLKKSDPATTIELINIAMERNITEAAPELLNICKSSTDKNIKIVAFKALSQLGDAKLIPEILSIILTSNNTLPFEEAESAVIALSSRINDPNQRSEPVLSQWNKATNENLKSSLLRIIGGIGDSAALEFLNKIANSQDQPALQDIAVREITRWQDPAAIPILENIYQSTENKTHRALAFRSCIRLLSSSASNSSNIQETIKHFERAIKNAQNADERKLILAGLPNAPDIKTLDFALSMLGEDAVKLEAAQATLNISSAIWGTNPGEVKQALNKIISSVSDDALRKQATALMKQIDQSIAYITVWSVAGPYFKEGNNYDALFNIVFPPEEKSANVNWNPIPAGTNPKQPFIVDLLKYFGGEQRVAYARSYIYSPVEQNARLEFGSDDGAKVWLNGKLIYSINVARPITPDSDKVNITLQKGWNELMLKITQNNLGWEYCVKVVKPDGSPLDNVRFSNKPQ